MRRAPALLLVPLLAAVPLAFAVPHLLGPADAPEARLAPASSEDAAFSTLVCPFATPDPTRPLERCNVRATAATGPANEIDLAMNPLDPQHLVVVAKDYAYHRQVARWGLGAVLTAYATSFDGGLTWTEGWLQPVNALATLPALGEVGTTDDSESDPVVDFAADGSVYVSTLRVNNDRGLPVYRSEDGGRTFVEVGHAYVGGTDKQWQVTDPLTGNIYLATLHQGGMGFVKSTDNGLTWTSPVKICNCRFPAIDVLADGTIAIVGYTGSKMVFVKSSDQGATWTQPVDVAPHRGVNWNLGNLRGFRTPNIQVLAADKGTGPFAGSLYTVWADHPPGNPTLPCVPSPPALQCTVVPDWDVYLAVSRDGGKTWSAPKRVNDDPTGLAAQFMPTVAVSPKGDVHVAWMDQAHDASGVTSTARYAHSADGGVTFEPSLLLSDLPFVTTLSHHQSASNAAFVGDYIGLQASDDRAVVAFPDTRYGRSDVFIATVV